MKRRDLERHLRDHGVELLREGGKHSFWGFDRERSAAVPRHREIKPGTVRAICRDLKIPAPEESQLIALPGRSAARFSACHRPGVLRSATASKSAACQQRRRARAGRPYPAGTAS